MPSPRAAACVVSAGLPAMGANFSYMHSGLVSDEKSILGSYMGSSASPERDIPRFLGLYKRGKLPVGSLKSGFLPLSEDQPSRLDRLADGTVLRQVLRPDV